MFSFAVFADVIEGDFMEALTTDRRRRAMMQAINKTTRDARARAAKLIREEVNLPARFVGPAQRRLYVSKQATNGNLESKITAQGRATSLARFVRGSPKTNAAGVYVEVQPGKPRFLKKAFLIKLPPGNESVTDTKFNLGLAIRLRKGETLSNKISARRVASGLYVLYGPSVSQVFRANDNTGVAEDMIPEIEKKLTAEFLRLLGL